MRKIRIYKDIKIQWRVLTNKEAAPLEGRNLTFEIVNKFGRAEFPFDVEGNLLTADFPGTAQKTLGAYWVTLWENKGGKGQTLVDSCAGFTLVSETCLEDDDDNTLNTEAVVELDSNIKFGVRGDSAYEVWKGQGYSGTQEDFLEWLRTPAKNAAEEAIRRADGAVAKIENTIEEVNVAESTRSESESLRQAAESERNKAEIARSDAEKERKSSEQERSEAEFNRASEFALLAAGSKTATANAQAAADRAENATIVTGIDIDGERGVITITAELGNN